MLAQPIQKLLSEYRSAKANHEAPDASAVIHVDEVAFRIARFYERVRNIIDYQEEHLLRKRVIYRALQRRIIFESENRAIAESLVKEIIRAGHLRNDAIPEAKLVEVQAIVDRLFGFLDATSRTEAGVGKKLSQWLIQIFASAVEECLDPPLEDRLLSEAMFETMRAKLAIKDIELSDADINTQLFIAIQRTLLRVDDDQLAYRFLKFVYPDWDNPSAAESQMITDQLPTIYANINDHIRHPAAPYFFKLCNRYNTAFYLIGDCVFRHDDGLHSFEEVVADHDQLHEAVARAYTKRYTNERHHLTRLAFLSVLSLFISKVIIALAIEIPIDKYVTDSYSSFYTMINILVPPALMFIILSFIRLPSSKNFDIVLSAVRDALADSSEETQYVVQVPKQRNPFVQQFMRGFYLLWSLALFSVLVVGLRALGFSIASTAVFILFLCLIIATGVKVHNRSKEISMEEDKATFLTLLYDLIAVPFAVVGKHVIAGLSRFQFLVMIVNFIDLPFQFFIDFVENLYSFVRSKRDQMF